MVYNRGLGKGVVSARAAFPGSTKMQINLTPDYSLLAILVIFIVNYFVVKTFFLRPINNVLEQREHETRTASEIYEQSLARFSEATARMEEQLHVAKREAAAL